MSEINLTKLIKKCRQKNLSAQSQLYQVFASKVFGVCLKYSRSYEDAEDVLQDSFITVFQKIHQFKGKGSFEGWLKRIAINTAIQKYRLKKEILSIDENEKELVFNMGKIEQSELKLDLLLSFVQTLPDQYRLVFSLYVLDGFSHKEVSEMLNISVGTSKSNLHRARLILQQKVTEFQKNQEK